MVRTQHFKAIIHSDFESLLEDRKGKELSSGGDSEYCLILRLLGFELWYNEKMQLTHRLPSDRLNAQYLRKLYAGFGRAEAILDLYYGFGHKQRFENQLNPNKYALAILLRNLKAYLPSLNPQSKLERTKKRNYINQLMKERAVYSEKKNKLQKTMKFLSEHESFTRK